MPSICESSRSLAKNRGADHARKNWARKKSTPGSSGPPNLVSPLKRKMKAASTKTMKKSFRRFHVSCRIYLNRFSVGKSREDFFFRGGGEL